jgi:hypothetical protein
MNEISKKTIEMSISKDFISKPKNRDYSDEPRD